MQFHGGADNGMNRLAKWLTGIVVFFYVLFMGLTRIVLPDLLQQVGPYAEKLAADYVNGTVQLGPVTWSGNNTLLIKDIVVRDREQRAVVMAPETRISINPFKGLSGLEKAVSAIDLEKPTVYLIQDKDESWNYEKLLKPSQSETTPFYGKINVRQGRFRYSCRREPGSIRLTVRWMGVTIRLLI